MGVPLGSSPQMLTVASAPGSPASGSMLLYFKSSDGLLYQKNSAGVEKVVATSTDTDSGWLDPTFATGWTTSTAQYRRINNQVFFRGNVTRTSGSATTLATLPAGYRPALSIATAQRTTNADRVLNFAVGTGGALVVGAGYATNDIVYLDSLFYLTD